ncbi:MULTISPECIES: helix-turn-helix domain-containing protein [Haloferacaceae]|uniref:Helix-turn-helix domain-containing protein n=1 Tax=Halorubrum glutamatedens TaxID=2707018 RepID=A0ABD5QM50_9EURY|nr:helix-turn-helix domain-containing protein [Halobellus captivus]
MTRSSDPDVDSEPNLGPEPTLDRGSPEGDPATSASTDAVDESLKTRTMDEAPVGITVADATRPDMPLIYANAAFERITGFPPSYAVGRNCRFLQGEATREKPVMRMRTAIEDGTATTVELRNYRRSGELFWNEVTIAPLRNDADEIVYYVGFQQDVTRRKRAEQAAADRASRIEHERNVQRRLLERLDGVVADVSEAVARASSRTELERAVVRSLSNTYAGAWIGTYDPASETIASRVAAGSTCSDAETLQVAIDGPGDRGVEAAITAAFDDRSVHLEPIESAESTAAAAVAGVPLYFGTATYGAIAVYVRTAEFREHERDVLTTVGRIVAIGLNALESQRTLHGDEVVQFRLAIDGHPLAAFAGALSRGLQYVGRVGDREERSLLFELADAGDVDVETIHAAAEETGIVVHAVLAEATDVPVIELSVGDASLRDLLREYSGELCGWELEKGIATTTVEVGREELARSLANDAMDRFETADLVEYRRHERRHETRHEFVAEIESRLTERQRAALVRAHTAGYFEWPHGTSGDELAESMGVSRSTFHQHLRAAQRKLATALFDR